MLNSKTADDRKTGKIMINVFDYLDYRKFLKEFYEEKKAQKPTFSHRYIASATGIDSSTFTKVINKQRNLSLNLAAKLIRVLKFKKKEADYFNLLILFDQSDNHEEKKMYLEQILSLRSVETKTLDAQEYEYFENWYFIAIRELLGFYRFKDDFNTLAAILTPPISPKEAKKAITRLEALGLIHKNDKGYYEPTERHVTTGDNWASVAITNYQLSTLRLAVEAVTRFPRRSIDFSTMTLKLSEAGLELVREKMKQLRKELAALEGSEPNPTSVYQVNLNAFPLTKTNIGDRL